MEKRELSMLEREFEIMVPQSFEVCLEGIDTLTTQGCLRSLYQPIKASINLNEDNHAEFKMRQSLGKNAGCVLIEGKIERIDGDTTKISGIASVHGIIPILIAFSLIALAFVVQDIQARNWWLLGITSALYPFAIYQFFYYRNRLIKTLEKAVSQ